MQRRSHAHRRQVGGAVAAGADVVQVGEIDDAPQVADAAGRSVTPKVDRPDR
jgi:hypothetical protein